MSSMKAEDLIRFEFREDILIAHSLVEDEIDLEIAELILEARLKLTADRDRKVITVFLRGSGMNKEARDFLGGPKGSEGISALAIVTNSQLRTMVANIFLSFNVKKEKIKTPMKIFKTVEEAYEWIKPL